MAELKDIVSSIPNKSKSINTLGLQETKIKINHIIKYLSEDEYKIELGKKLSLVELQTLYKNELDECIEDMFFNVNNIYVYSEDYAYVYLYSEADEYHSYLLENGYIANKKIAYSEYLKYHHRVLTSYLKNQIAKSEQSNSSELFDKKVYEGRENQKSNKAILREIIQSATSYINDKIAGKESYFLIKDLNYDDISGYFCNKSIFEDKDIEDYKIVIRALYLKAKAVLQLEHLSKGIALGNDVDSINETFNKIFYSNIIKYPKAVFTKVSDKDRSIASAEKIIDKTIGMDLDTKDTVRLKEYIKSLVTECEVLETIEPIRITTLKSQDVLSFMYRIWKEKYHTKKSGWRKQCCLFTHKVFSKNFDWSHIDEENFEEHSINKKFADKGKYSHLE